MTYADLTTKQQTDYAGLDPESKTYPLEFDGKVLRFVPNRGVQFAVDHINLNDLWIEAARNRWPLSELMSLYRQMGYSCCGFLDIFADKMETWK